jgi:hypothetical protein
MPRDLKRAEDDASPETQADNNVWGMISILANENTDESRLLELYYWSQEPGVMEMVRAYLEMNERARLTLGNFLLTVRPQSIVASRDETGALILSQAGSPKTGAENGNRPARRASRRS